MFMWWQITKKSTKHRMANTNLANQIQGSPVTRSFRSTAFSLAKVCIAYFLFKALKTTDFETRYTGAETGNRWRPTCLVAGSWFLAAVVNIQTSFLSLRSSHVGRLAKSRNPKLITERHSTFDGIIMASFPLL